MVPIVIAKILPVLLAEVYTNKSYENFLHFLLKHHLRFFGKLYCKCACCQTKIENSYLLKLCTNSISSLILAANDNCLHGNGFVFDSNFKLTCCCFTRSNAIRAPNGVLVWLCWSKKVCRSWSTFQHLLLMWGEKLR